MERFNAQERNKNTPEAMVESLKEMVLKMSDDINDEIREFLPEEIRDGDLVDKNGMVREEMYSSEYGGPISPERIKQFKQFIETRERDWSGADDERVRKYFYNKYNISTEEELVEVWKEEKEKSEGSLAEMAVTLLMHKFLKDDFYVLRTNPYDDYAHGVDNVIIEKKTGAVVCTFDEYMGSDEDDRFIKKLDQERGKAMKHGATVTYGLGVENGEGGGKRKIVPQTVRDIPTFALPISKEESHALISELSEDLNDDVSMEVFAKIITSLSEQSGYYKENLPEGSPVLARVEDFMQALSGIQKRFDIDVNIDGDIE